MTDLEFAIDILPRVSRTFALSIEALPEPLRASIRVAYLLCRVVDTIEDDLEMARDEQQWLFSEFSRVVGDDAANIGPLEQAFAAWAGTADRELCRNVGAPLRLFRELPRPLADASRPHILEMARGMALYAKRWQGPDSLTVLEDVDDLEQYCFFVAGTVGNLLTATFLAKHDELPRETRQGLSDRAVRFGLGLQLTNIVKDVSADHDRGWCFLPAALCAQREVSPGELLEPACRDRAMAVVRDVVELARGHLDEAVAYTLLLPPTAREIRLFVLVPLALALATTTLVEQSPQVLTRGDKVKVSRSTVAATLQQAQKAVGDDEGIRALCARAAAGEL